MSDSTIGIKVADGSYYPVIAVDYRGTKKLILTTARANQEKVRVDLYRGSGASLAQARYIDTLIIENIPPASQGEPEIELLIGIDEDGQLMAEAFDQSTGERQRFDTSVDSLPLPMEGEPAFVPEESAEIALDEGPFEVPEGDFSDDTAEGEGLLSVASRSRERREEASLDLEEPALTGEDYAVDERDRREEAVRRGRPNLLLLVLFVVLGIALVGAIAYFVYRAISGPAVPPLPSNAAASPAATAPAPSQPAPAAAPAPAKPAPAAAPAPAPAAPAPKSVTYRIKQGDTLWDISSTYYKNPWLYPKIAKANSIPNPDLIFAGTQIRIPEN